MSTLAALAQSNPATHVQLLHSMYAAGAHGAARSAWIEINRPLTALGIGPALTAVAPATVFTPFGSGVTVPTVSLPIGMDIKSITATQGDIDAGWLVVNFTFGTLNLVNPQGSGYVNLSMFSPYLEHVDRLAPWILSKTKVDVQVSAQVFNQSYTPSTLSPATGNSAIFHGFSLNAFQEEQVCAIQTRIEPTDRNVGNAELINHFRQTIGLGLGIQMPAYQQGPGQFGRVPLLTQASLGAVHSLPFASQLQAPRQQIQQGYGLT